MRIVSVLGSPHGARGNTARLLTPLLRVAAEAGAEIEEFSLATVRVEPCRACEACHRTGACPINDDYNKVRDAMLAADALVLASPNYMFSVSAQMKALLDRLSGPLHCQMLVGRYGAAVVSAGADCDEVEQYLLRFLRAMGCWTVGSVGASALEMFDSGAFERKATEAKELGNALVGAVRKRRTFPEQEAERRVFFERMKALILHRRDDWQHEYNYWLSQGHL